MPEFKRPRLLVLMMSAMNLRDFADCGALTLLAERFDIDFVCNDPGIADQLKPYGQVRFRHTNPLPRYWLWNCASTIENLRKYRKVVRNMDRQFFNRKSAGKSYWHWTTKLGEGLHRFGLGAPASGCMKWLLDRSSGLAFKADREASYAAAIVPTVLRDIAAEDVVRWSRKAGITSIAIQGNWDCFNLKQMLADPDHFLVWGEQSWYFARLLQGFPHAALHVVGSQRHDHYLGPLPDKAAARRQLGLSLDKRLLLFCGVIGPFDEQTALRELDNAITAGRLPADVEILYKPHPRTPPDKGADKFDQQGYRHIRLIGFRGRNVWNSLEEYPALLRSVDATMSPYSTMGLESGLCGRPTLCLGFHSNPDSPYWRYALEFMHIQSYRFMPWAVRCDRKEDFIDAVARLLALAARPNMEQTAIDSTSHIVYRDPLRYPERMCGAIESIIGGKVQKRTTALPATAVY